MLFLRIVLAHIGHLRSLCLVVVSKASQNLPSVCLGMLEFVQSVLQCIICTFSRSAKRKILQNCLKKTWERVSVVKFVDVVVLPW